MCQGEVSDLKCALRTQEEIQQWIRKHKYSISISGKPGTGKKTLAKGLREYTPQETDHLEVHATKVTSYKQIYDQVKFMVFDTGFSPDLEDVAQIPSSEQPDAIVFTLKMDDTTLSQDDLKAIQSITKAFGWKVWRNAMFILTFANRISKPGHSTKSRENTVYFNAVRNKFALEVTETLMKVNVESDVANRIPVIPVGLVSEPFIESDGRGVSWVEEFWDVLFELLEVPEQEVPKQDPPDPNQDLPNQRTHHEEATESSPTHTMHGSDSPAHESDSSTQGSNSHYYLHACVGLTFWVVVIFQFCKHCM